jgi:NAD-dependent deacetylase
VTALPSSAVDQAAALVRGSRRISVLTGAGISTESGIPDFRSPTGLYSDERNANVFDIRFFRTNPEGFYRFAREFYPIIAAAKPNAAHEVLAKWERAGKDVRIATQNIDDLHQRASSKHVYPVHGTMLTSTCQGCGRTCESGKLVSAVLAGQIPSCDCGGVFKPDITFFGELLPEKAWFDSTDAMSRADLVLVLGTSLVVHPAASLPDYRPASSKLIVVNRDGTHLDGAADIVSHDELAAFMAAVDRLI